ncbi:glucose-6-phosphate dehydrogenase [Buchnera aphidicola]|uniref:glucose-6-phosphate dehydrogenase n=1 Tax=Buchnera aphidicola TaxID=9 RepID=UPI00094D9176|nr:glucose-6-phosphate dehydrogenase [Buchnera aphidicola]
MIIPSHLYTLIIFGATGDLAQRKLFPALYRLEKRNKLINNIKIIGVSRANYCEKKYLEVIYNALKKFLNEEISIDIWKTLKKRFLFCQLDVNKTEDFKKLNVFFKQKNNILINYLAVSFDLLINICRGLQFIGFNKKNSKIVIEKPIGNSLNTFNLINTSIKKHFNENQIFRIDHYLGKEALMNLISLKFANPFFNNNFNYKHVDHVQVTLSENIGIEGRWDYFNKTGQIIDMVQNHVLQIISIFAMNAPKSLTKKHIIKEKIKILKSLRLVDEKNIKEHISLGQYSSKDLNGQITPHYLNKNNANKANNTETFVAIKLYIDNKIWKNVPFYIRTGKRLPKKCSKIVVFFKKKTEHLFSPVDLGNMSNRLVINLQSPPDIRIKFFNKVPTLNSNLAVKPFELSFNYKKIFKGSSFFEEYDKLLSEIIQDNQFLFVHYKEIIYAWKWIDPIIRAYKANLALLQNYESGTWGPDSSQKLIEQDKKKWDNS